MKKTLLLVLMIILMFSVIVQASLDFSLQTNEAKAAVRTGNYVVQAVSIFNSGETREFTASKVHGGEFYQISNPNLLVDENSYGSFDLVLGNSSLSPEVYVDELSISAGNVEKMIPVVLEVETFGNLLFDSAIEIVKGSPIVPGGNFTAKVKIYNLGALQDAVLAKYEILNLNGSVAFQQEETLSVVNPIEITKSFTLPENMLEGTYVFAVSTTQDGSKASSVELFSLNSGVLLSPIIKTDVSKKIGFFIILFLMVSVIILSYYWNKRVLNQGKEWRTKVNEIKSVKFGDAARSIRRLGYQKDLLEKAYGSHYVTRESYEEGKREINSLLNKLKKRL